MTDVEALKECINDSGMTMTALAEKSGILRETLYNRMRTGDFKLSEICALSKALRLDRNGRDKIFFANESELNSANNY
ncbi:MAG: XRE family transcriptional regulator [Lachnospiraceae bacterium]|nr:XRE family transcriptional regulator [Lachnospiraceae bacterium]